MATRTLMNEGLRQNFVTFGDRNFENDGTTQYAARRPALWWVDGATYNVGDTLPYDVGGASYSKAATALLRKYWDQGWLTPLA